MLASGMTPPATHCMDTSVKENEVCKFNDTLSQITTLIFQLKCITKNFINIEFFVY